MITAPVSAQGKRLWWLLTLQSSRNFRASPVNSIGFGNPFKRGQPEPIQKIRGGDMDPVERTDRQAAKLDIVMAKSLSSYDKAALQSIADKGLGKTVVPYQPPSDVADRFQRICQEALGDLRDADPSNIRFPNREAKFKILVACEKAFAYSIPSSLLHQMVTVGNVLNYYQTPIAGTNGLTQFQKMDLPKNMHVSYESIRFDPDNDPYYGGISAFPHRSTYVTGLKAKKMYKGHKAETTWPKVLDVRETSAPVRRHDFANPFAAEP